MKLYVVLKLWVVNYGSGVICRCQSIVIILYERISLNNVSVCNVNNVCDSLLSNALKFYF
jgi:hypothetical protein